MQCQASSIPKEKEGVVQVSSKKEIKKAAATKESFCSAVLNMIQFQSLYHRQTISVCSVSFLTPSIYQARARVFSWEKKI